MEPPVHTWSTTNVAHWLARQNLRHAYADTFIVHAIDGPALLALTREQLRDWKVKQADCTEILAGVVELRRRDELARQQPATAAPPHKPATPETHHHTPQWTPASPSAKQQQPLERSPAKGNRSARQPRTRPEESKLARSRSAAQMTPAAAQRPERTPTKLKPSTSAASLGAATSPARKGAGVGSPAPRKPTSAWGAATPGSDGGCRGGAASSSTHIDGGYLRSVMSVLHADERVPLWKEELLDRARSRRDAEVVRAGREAASGSQQASAKPPPPPQLSAAAPEQPTTAPLSAAERRELEQELRERERRLQWYRDALHEHEAARQLLEEKEHELTTIEREIQASLLTSETRVSGLSNLDRNLQQKLEREKLKLTRQVQVADGRAAEANANAKKLEALINSLRTNRQVFTRRVAKSEQRESAMGADMTFFAQAAHASLDAKEKLDFKLRRLVADYKHDRHDFKKLVGQLSNEAERIDASSAHIRASIEDMTQRSKRDTYVSVRASRDAENTLETRLGYTLNQKGLYKKEAEALSEILGAPLNPYDERQMHALVTASRANEERNASLARFNYEEEEQIETLEEELAALKAEMRQLLDARKAAKAASVAAKGRRKSVDASLKSLEANLAAVEQKLGALCEPTQALRNVMSKSITLPRNSLAIPGDEICRPSNLVATLGDISSGVRALRDRASRLRPPQPTNPERESSLGNLLLLSSEEERRSPLSAFVRPMQTDHLPTVAEAMQELNRVYNQTAQIGIEAKKASAATTGSPPATPPPASAEIVPS